MDNRDLYYHKTDTYTIRPIQESDYHRSYLPLLAQLTEAPDITFEHFKQILEANSQTSVIVVVHHQPSDKIIGTFKLLFDYKFSRSGAVKAHLEDVVVDEGHRKAGLGSRMMEVAKGIAKEKGCYKVIGTSKNSDLGFYVKNGFDGVGASFYWSS